MPSIFTKIIAREIPATIVAETNDIIVIKDIAPKAPIHLLIVPKKEICDIQACTPDDMRYITAIMAMAQQLSKTIPGAEHFRLICNCGEQAGQRVFHLHFHFLAGQHFID
jgi:histidine triad (HIT) family protein